MNQIFRLKFAVSSISENRDFLNFFEYSHSIWLAVARALARVATHFYSRAKARATASIGFYNLPCFF